MAEGLDQKETGLENLERRLPAQFAKSVTATRKCYRASTTTVESVFAN